MTELDHKHTRDEIKRAVIVLIRLGIELYGMSWGDFQPREDNRIIRALAKNQSATYIDQTESRPGS